MPKRTSANRSQTRKPSANHSLDYSTLEPRNLLAGISLVDGTLILEGSTGDDVFRVTQVGNEQLQVGVLTPDRSEFLRFLLADIDSIEVNGRSGDDLFNNRSSLRSTFFGHNGNDRGFGGRGSDTFFGGNGDDFFFGRQGTDTAFGGDGNDRLIGSDHADVLNGQSGDDVLIGSSGDDELIGGDGNDRLLGTGGEDTITGGDGNDFVSGGSGIDFLQGDAGDDVLRGGDDADELLGGLGRDLLFADAGNDVSRGGQGDDYIFDFAGDVNFIFGDQGNDILRGGSGDDEIHGGQGNDRLLGGAGDDTLYGGLNADFLRGGDGRDGLFGGRDARDRLIGGADDDRFLVAVNENINDGQFLDLVVDARQQDAVISLVSNRQIETNQVFAANVWTDAEIESVDGALRNLHLATSSTRLLKLANGQNLSLVRLGSVTTPSGSSILGLNFNDSNEIGFTDQLFNDFSDRIRETVYHEIGHNFDTADENALVTEFRAISNWDQINNPGDRLSLDGEWYYNDDFSNFLQVNARTNPLEDFAITFAEHFQRTFDGFTRAFINPVEKFAVIDQFIGS